MGLTTARSISGFLTSSSGMHAGANGIFEHSLVECQTKRFIANA